VTEQTSLSSETVFKDMYTFNIQCQSAEIILLKRERVEQVVDEESWAKERNTW